MKNLFCLVFLLILATVGCSSEKVPLSKPRILTVYGEGQASGAPDRLTITLGVETHGANAAAALGENSRITQSVVDLLKSRGVLDKDIQTSRLSINPDYSEEGRVIAGYAVSNFLTVTVNDLSQSGALVDALSTAAGNSFRIQGLNFSIANPEPLLSEARKSAVEQAKKQALELSDASGVKLGKILSIEEGGSHLPSPQPYMEMASFKRSVPIQAGSQELSVGVTMVFELR